MMKTICISMTFLLTCSAWAGPLDAQVDKILVQYFMIQTTLSNDSTKGIEDVAKRVAKLAAETRANDPKVQNIFDEVEKAALTIKEKDLKQARAQFFELTKPLFAYVHQFYSGQKNFYRYYCSMEQKGWIQRGKEMRNPYMGKAMLACGELVP